MRDEITKVLYQRKRQIYLPAENTGKLLYVEMEPVLAMLYKETGLVLSKNAIKEARKVSYSTFLKIVTTIVEQWKKERGADFNMRTMYKNFPQSVMDMPDYELIANAILGYLVDSMDSIFETDGKFRESILFDGEKKDREALPVIDEKTESLEAGDIESYCLLVRDLISSKASFSNSEKEIVRNAMEGIAYALYNVSDILPDEIPQKDNLAFVVTKFLEKGFAPESFPLNNATDAMRVANEINHTEYPNEYKFRNKEKIFLYSVMERDKNLCDNIRGKEKEFKALIRGLNGLKNADKRFPKTSAVFDLVKANKALPVSFMGKYNAMKNEDAVQAASLLVGRPGIFAKEIVSLIAGKCEDKEKEALKIVKLFASVASKIPVRTLFILRNYLIHRVEGQHVKTVFVANAGYAYNKNDLPISSKVEFALMGCIDEAIKDQLAQRNGMGKVYVSTEYQGIPIPHDTKTEGDAMRPVTRGTKFKLPEQVKTIRAFIYWVGYDLDLSASLLDENFKAVGHVSWTNLKDSWGCHSGDITNAPNGASEFIDINLDAFEKENKDARYVAFSVHVYSGESFKYTKDCMFGYMERSEVNSGEIYEPKTVAHAFNLDLDSYTCTTMVLDIKTREIVWAELPVGASQKFEGLQYIGSCIENKGKGLSASVLHVMTHPYPSMYDVLTFNASMRGELVYSPESADIVYGIEPISDKLKEEMKLKEEVRYYDMFARETWGDML